MVSPRSPKPLFPVRIGTSLQKLKFWQAYSALRFLNRLNGRFFLIYFDMSSLCEVLKCPLLIDRGKGCCDGNGPVSVDGDEPMCYTDCARLSCGDGLRKARNILSKADKGERHPISLNVEGELFLVVPFGTEHKPRGRYVVWDPTSAKRGVIVTTGLDGRLQLGPQRILGCRRN